MPSRVQKHSPGVLQHLPLAHISQAAAKRGLALLATFALIGGSSSGSTQQGAADGEWRYWGGDARSTHYSALDQINRDNVGDLEIVWRWTARNFGPQPETRNQNTPLMIDGVLYAAAGQTRSAVAIDPGTGETLWTFRLEEGERGTRAPRFTSGRGVAYWSDGNGDDRVFLITPGYHLVSIHADSGRPVSSFGEDGVLDLMVGVRGDMSAIGKIGNTSPAMVVGDVVVVGSAQEMGMNPSSYRNVKGDVRGFDARTGELLWTFHTIPEPGEFGYETWEEGSAAYTGNAGVWAPFAADLELGYVYLPVETATSDYYGGHRPGDNLFADSLVCLDARTGERVWYFQFIHHDIWDWDIPAAPILIDITVDGRPIQAVAQVTKQAFTFVFDRVTGDPVWPIEEIAVPESDVPGENTAPTQPHPTKPAPFDRQGFSEDDLIDFTPELRRRALEVIANYRMGSLFTPPSVRNGPDGTQGTLMLPRATGGANWEGAVADPETGILYVPSVTNPTSLAVTQPDPERSDMRYWAASGEPRMGGLPIVKPPWGRITAIDLNSGEHVWMKPNGEASQSVRQALQRMGVDVTGGGKQSRAGLLVTKTLLFAGEGQTGGPFFRAHDKATGEVVAELELPATQVGLPMTYMHEGRQFIVMTIASGSGSAAELIALALPQ